MAGGTRTLVGGAVPASPPATLRSGSGRVPEALPKGVLRNNRWGSCRASPSPWASPCPRPGWPSGHMWPLWSADRTLNSSHLVGQAAAGVGAHGPALSVTSCPQGHGVRAAQEASQGVLPPPLGSTSCCLGHEGGVQVEPLGWGGVDQGVSASLWVSWQRDGDFAEGGGPSSTAPGPLAHLRG